MNFGITANLQRFSELKLHHTALLFLSHQTPGGVKPVSRLASENVSNINDLHRTSL